MTVDFLSTNDDVPKMFQIGVYSYWQISETILLENSSKREHLVENNNSQILGQQTPFNSPFNWKTHPEQKI